MKYIYAASLKDKTVGETLEVFQCYCFMCGFSKKIPTDNGKEFTNKKMEAFCKHNKIKLAHSSPQTPTTQGLVKRSNPSWKEDMRALILSTSSRLNFMVQKLLECTCIKVNVSLQLLPRDKLQHELNGHRTVVLILKDSEVY